MAEILISDYNNNKNTKNTQTMRFTFYSTVAATALLANAAVNAFETEEDYMMDFPQVDSYQMTTAQAEADAEVEGPHSNFGSRAFGAAQRERAATNAQAKAKAAGNGPSKLSMALKDWNPPRSMAAA